MYSSYTYSTVYVYKTRYSILWRKKSCVYILRDIEYQFRDLPHFHMVLQLEDCNEGFQFMDKFITTNISDLSAEDPVRLHIEKSMIHKCSASTNGCLNAKGICKRGYQTNEIRPTNSLDDKGYSVYKRLSEVDIKVVPTNNKDLIQLRDRLRGPQCPRSQQRHTWLQSLQYQNISTSEPFSRKKHALMSRTPIRILYYYV